LYITIGRVLEGAGGAPLRDTHLRGVRRIRGVEVEAVDEGRDELTVDVGTGGQDTGRSIQRYTVRTRMQSGWNKTNRKNMQTKARREQTIKSKLAVITKKQIN
jgi:hypothetical protein